MVPMQMREEEVNHARMLVAAQQIAAVRADSAAGIDEHAVARTRCGDLDTRGVAAEPARRRARHRNRAADAPEPNADGKWRSCHGPQAIKKCRRRLVRRHRPPADMSFEAA